jgi:3-oxoacyl-[acyl-carrier-protein] synthase III
MTPAASDTWIVGMGEARTAPLRDDVSINEFAWEAVSPALADAGVELAEVTGAVTASQDFWDGRTISSMNVNEIACGSFGSEAKVASDCVQAIGYACARVDDGDQHLNVVVAHAKESQGDAHTIELAAFDPYFERQLNPDDTIVAAFQAAQLYARGGAREELSARVVAAARERSAVLERLGVPEVLASAPTATPLRVLDRAPLMDAAAAMVICCGERRAKIGRPAVRIVATATRTGAYWRERTDLTAVPWAAQAAAEALERAGWSLGEIDVVELAAPFAHQHLMIGEAIGLGAGETLVGRFENGEVNDSGGWLAGSAGSVAGLHSAIAAARRLRAGEGRRALVCSTSGLAAQSHHVVLLEAAA